jgi:ribosome-associated translation inhibitor RaiA
MNKTAQEMGFSVQVETAGDVTPDLVEYGRQKVAAVGRYTSEPILFARVSLSYAGDRAVERRSLAQANLDWNGRPMRCHVARRTMREAIDALEDRLRERLIHSVRNWEALRGRRAAPGLPEWRHGAPATERPDWFPRPAEERQVITRASMEFVAATPDEAALDLEMLDYAFILFSERATGRDSVLYRTMDGYGLVQLAPAATDFPPVKIPLMVSPIPAPVLTLRQAIDRLDMTGLRFAFFEVATTGRGAVVYHRYDGHLGLVTLAA